MREPTRRRGVWRPAILAAGLLVAAVACTGPGTPPPPGSGSPAWSASGCAPLGPPAGPVIDLAPSDASRLAQVVAAAPAGTTIRLADGTYPLPDDFTGRLYFRQPNVTLRSASGNPAGVVLDGGYTTAELVNVLASNVTISDLTLTRAQDHLVHAYPADGAPAVTNLVLHRLRLIDAGEQFVKVNANSGRIAWVDSGTLSCSQLTMTATGRMHIERAFGCYTGGIDVHGGQGWSVRSNTFEGIYCEDGEVAEHAVHFWIGSRDTVVENNLIKDCSRGIGLGLQQAGTARHYADDPYPGLFVDHYGGVVRNNVVAATIPQYDTGIELDQARGTRVLHNTVVESAGATGSFSSIDYRFANTQVEVTNNLARRVTARDGAQGTLASNVAPVPLTWFVDAGAGDAHLRSTATGAIDQGQPASGSGTELDGAAHSAGAGPDVGADEYG